MSRLVISKYFDGQMEDYLLRDARRRDRLQGLTSDGCIKYHEEGEDEWLTITGPVADLLKNGQEIIYKVHKRDGSFRDAVILQVEKREEETYLYNREPWVELGKLKGNIQKQTDIRH